ncbi:CPBP family intramembrane glutamic endopeptidase [Ferruginibacter sp. SUN002]|uniref:CPBP family intramembrane glutamic endopeptidase n=1 Tax=Ferruginibacter sp. SUN002 TaxID=2937789 RepID=UPI003D366EED
MQYKSARGFTGWAQLGILFGFLGVGLILAGAIQLYFGYKALGANSLPLSKVADAMLEALMKPENAVYMQLSQIFGTFFLLFIPSVAFIIVCHKKFSWAGFNAHFNLLQIGLAFLIILATTPFATPFADISKSVLAHFPAIDKLAQGAEETYNKAVMAMSGLKTWPQFFTGVFIIAFLPALFEELAFRGVLQNLLVKWIKKPIVAIVITSLVFSLVHASYYLFISRFILGLSLGLLFYRSKNIWVNTFAHFMNNLMALTQLFFLNKTKGAKIDVNDMDMKMPIWSLFITLTILIGLFIVFEKLSSKNRQAIEAKEAAEVPYSDNPFTNYA